MNLTLEQAIGANIARIRSSTGLTMRVVGERMTEAGGKLWSAQQVWDAEHGRRSFAAADLVAVARALETTVGELLDVAEPVTLNRAVELTVPQMRQVLGQDFGRERAWLQFHRAADVLDVWWELSDARAAALRDIEAQWDAPIGALRTQWEELIAQISPLASGDPELQARIEQYREAAAERYEHYVQAEWEKHRALQPDDGRPRSEWVTSSDVLKTTPALKTAESVLGISNPIADLSFLHTFS